VLRVMPSLGYAHGDNSGALGHGRIGGLRATVALEAFGPRSQGLRGFVRPNFRVANIAKSVKYRRNVRNVLNRTKT